MWFWCGRSLSIQVTIFHQLKKNRVCVWFPYNVTLRTTGFSTTIQSESVIPSQSMPSCILQRSTECPSQFRSPSDFPSPTVRMASCLQAGNTFDCTGGSRSRIAFAQVRERQTAIYPTKGTALSRSLFSGFGVVVWQRNHRFLPNGIWCFLFTTRHCGHYFTRIFHFH